MFLVLKLIKMYKILDSYPLKNLFVQIFIKIYIYHCYNVLLYYILGSNQKVCDEIKGMVR